MALVGSLIFTLTLIPALCSFFLGRHVEEKENKIVSFLNRKYSGALRWTMAHSKKVVWVAVLSVVLSFIAFPFLGSEFIPRLDEESLSIQSVKPTGISLTESVKLSQILEKTLLGFPEVLTVFGRTGTAEIATDPMGPNVTDTYIMMKGKVKDKKSLVEKMEAAVSLIPGMAFGFSQPIELRVNELIAGVRSDIAIKVFGDDLEVLKEKGEEIQKVVSAIRGAKDARAEQVSGLPILQVEIDRAKIARYGINAADLLNIIEMAVGGKSAGEVFDGIKRFDIVLRYAEKYRNSPEAIGNILITSPGGEKIPVSQLVKKIAIEEGPAQISHEQARRRVVVEVNVRGRDIGSFVAEAKEAIEKKVKLSAGYSLEWGGQFKNLEEARVRLLIVVPLSLLLIFILLFSAFNSVKQAFLVFTGI
ncbi:MAG: efflux RND transporter permease subunit, partial [Candidatus Omnitrophota bacterium]